ncbi:MAG TPA: hypothetical protein VGG26_03010 [Terracidiphilus sp.]|jgi:hypothetical protein
MQAELKVSIVRFTLEHQPGIVECEFFDADGVRYTMEDKVPIFTADDLWSDSDYPRERAVQCELLDPINLQSRRELVRIKVSPALISSSFNEAAEIVVFAKQLLF